MGFASALATQTLPQYGVTLSLVLFNLGIEAAQLVAASLTGLLLICLPTQIITAVKLRQLCASLAVVAAAYWFITLIIHPPSV